MKSFVYDCFLFYNELEILDIRLHELTSAVDKFVLVESTVTHTNKPKPLFFNDNKHLFTNFKHKIIHVVVDDSPNVSLAWIINDFQFSQMVRGLKNCKPQDTVLFGDLDEIPRAEKVLEWKDKPGSLKVFMQDLSYYYLNFVEYKQGKWLGTHMIQYKDLRKFKTTWVAKYSPPDVQIPDGGWHLSYIGGVKRIREKLSIMTHQEYNNDRYNTPEKILKAMYKQEDFLGLGYKFKIEGQKKLPGYVQQNKMKFKGFILERSKNKSLLYFLIPHYLDIRDMLRVIYRQIRRKIFNVG